MFSRLFLLMLAAEILSMASFANFAVLLPELKPLWALSNTEAGWIGGIYLGGYVVAVPILVGLTDSIDARRIYLGSCVIGALGSLGFALFADGFWTAMLFRFLSGVSLAGTYMPGLQILNDRLDATQRLKAVPWYTSFFGIGTGLSYYLTGQLIEFVDWRLVFALCGLGLVMSFLIVWLSVAPSPPPPPPTAGRRHPLDFRPVFSNFPALAHILGYTGHTFELFAFRAWVVAFLVFAAAAAGVEASRPTISLYVSIYSVVGVPASIVFAEVALRRGRERTVTWLMVACAAIAALLGFLAGAPFLAVVLVGAIYSASIMSDSAAHTAGTVSAARTSERGATLAMHSVFGFFGGFLGPLGVGVVLDLAGGQQSGLAWGLAFVAMGAGSALGLVGCKVMLAQARRRAAV